MTDGGDSQQRVDDTDESDEESGTRQGSVQGESGRSGCSDGGDRSPYRLDYPITAWRQLRRELDRRHGGDLTSGEIALPMLSLSVPIVGTYLLQTTFNLVDAVWMGRYSTTGLAAISFSFPISAFFVTFGLGISISGSILVAQHKGADEERKVDFVAAQTVMFSVAISLVMGVAGYYAIESVLRLLGAPPDILTGATAYLEIVSLGIVFMICFLVFVDLMRGYGDTVTPMAVMFVAVVVNAVLDPVFIFGWGPAPRLGIVGAAYVTVFSRLLAAFVGFGIMIRGDRGVALHLRDMRPDPAQLRQMVGIAVPASIEGTGNALASNLMLPIVGRFSTEVVAAYGVGVRTFSLVLLPAVAVGRGVDTMVGQNIGASQTARATAATHATARVVFALLTGVGVVTWLGAGHVAAVFSDDPAVVRTGREFLRYVSLTFGCIGIFHIYKGGFRGAGRMLTAAAVTLAVMAGTRLPVAWAVVKSFGHRGIWLGFAASNLVGAVLAFWLYRRSP
jgi:putative MATE family efflux protein